MYDLKYLQLDAIIKFLRNLYLECFKLFKSQNADICAEMEDFKVLEVFWLRVYAKICIKITLYMVKSMCN